MAVVTGEIRGPGRQLRGVLIEVFSVPNEFQNRLPLRSRDRVTDDGAQRLGLTMTDDRGRFQLEYAATLRTVELSSETLANYRSR